MGVTPIHTATEIERWKKIFGTVSRFNRRASIFVCATDFLESDQLIAHPCWGVTRVVSSLKKLVGPRFPVAMQTPQGYRARGAA